MIELGDINAAGEPEENNEPGLTSPTQREAREDSQQDDDANTNNNNANLPYLTVIARKIVFHWLFDSGITVAIFVNCVFMALEDPGADCDGDETNCDGLQRFIAVCEFVFLAIFTGEAVVKLVALGVVVGVVGDGEKKRVGDGGGDGGGDGELNNNNKSIGCLLFGWKFPYSYFGDGWNVLDFTVVVVGYLSLIPGVGNLQALRTFRLLRTLRSISHVKAMKQVVGALVSALPLLFDVLLLVSFLTIVFSILGLHLFKGVLRRYCAEYNSTTMVTRFPDSRDDWQPCSTSRSGGFQCTHHLSPFTHCSKHPSISSNPNSGITNYDHIGFSLLTVFQLTSAEGWTEIMYQTQDATTDWAVLFYLLVICFGSLIALSIVFAALESSWGEVTDGIEEEKKQSEPQETFLQRQWSNFRNLSVVKALFSIDLAGTTAGGYARQLTETSWFDKVVFYAILGNTIVLALYRDNISKSEEDALDTVNLILTIFFALEMAIKIFAFNFSGYRQDTMNVFDGTIVVVSLIELAASSNGILSVFRALRLLRVLRLIRSWSSLHQIITGLTRSIKGATSLIMVLLLLLFIFALLGKEFFGKKFDVNDERYNYDNFLWSFASVFVVVTGENWNSLMYEAMANEGNGYAIFFVVLLVLGNYVILNLFIAILLEGLEEAHKQHEKDLENTLTVMEIRELETKKHQVNELVKGELERHESADSEKRNEEAEKAAGAAEAETPQPQKQKRTKEELLRERFDFFDKNSSGFIDEKEIKQLLEYFNIEMTMLEFNIIFADDQFSFDEFVTLINTYNIDISDDFEAGQGNNNNSEEQAFSSTEIKLLAQYDLDPKMLATRDMEMSDKIILEGNSLFLISPNSSSRQLCADWAQAKWFNNFILGVIVLSTIAVALEEPGRSQDFKDALNVIDIIFTVIFVIELIIKVIAMGFILGSNSYLRSSHFNKLDFVIVALSVTTLFIDDSSGGAEVSSLKALRAFRALRPLRTVGRVETLKVVVNALSQSLVPMGNALALMGFFFFMFAILGVHLFAGKYNFCRDVSTVAVEQGTRLFNTTITCPSLCVSSPKSCSASDCFDCFDSSESVWISRQWDTYDQNFDNVINAMVVLFEMSTLEAWPSIALNAVDSTGEHSWPNPNEQRSSMLYFIAFIMIGTFFAAQLFTSVACDKFQRMSEFYGGTIFLTDSQRAWVANAKAAVKARPVKVANDPILTQVEPIVQHPWFDNTVMACIMLNMLVLAMYTEDMSTDFENVLEGVNLALMIVFALEAVMKVLGLGFVAYVTDNWNKFDAVIVIMSFINLAVDVGPMASVFRVFRLARIIKLIPRAQSLMAVVMTMITALPALFNVGVLMMLFFVIYASLGVSLFGRTIHGEFLNRHANFETFPRALITLFRVSTGEDWNGIMYDAALSKNEYNSANEQCSSQQDNCGIDIASQFYFISFNILAAFVLLNLVVAAVLIAFEQSKQRFSEGLTNSMVDAFKKEWNVYDPDADARIPVQAVRPLYFKVSTEIFKSHPTQESCDAAVKKMEIVDNQVRFGDVLFVLAFENFGTTLGASDQAKKLEKRLVKQNMLLDGELDGKSRTIIPRVTEKQLMEMDVEEIREELRLRGAVRAQRVQMESLQENTLKRGASVEELVQQRREAKEKKKEPQIIRKHTRRRHSSRLGNARAEAKMKARFTSITGDELESISRDQFVEMCRELEIPEPDPSELEGDAFTLKQCLDLCLQTKDD